MVGNQVSVRESNILSLVKECILQPCEIVQWQSALDHHMSWSANYPVYQMWIWNSFLRFLSWSSLSLGDSSASLDPKLHPPHFYLRSSLRSFPGYRAPFLLVSTSLPSQTPSQRQWDCWSSRNRASFKPRSGKKYLSYTLSKKVIDWKASWFYIGNHAPALPDRTLGPPKIFPEWNSTGQNIDQINDMLRKIKDLRRAIWLEHQLFSLGLLSAFSRSRSTATSGLCIGDPRILPILQLRKLPKQKCIEYVEYSNKFMEFQSCKKHSTSRIHPQR